MLYRRRRAYVKPAASAADRFSLSTSYLVCGITKKWDFVGFLFARKRGVRLYTGGEPKQGSGDSEVYRFAIASIHVNYVYIHYNVILRNRGTIYLPSLVNSD